jgi:Mrp family chromosome partitioning ATPase
MSRNFDVLQRAGKQETLVGQSNGALPTGDPITRPSDYGEPAHHVDEIVKLVHRVFVFPNSQAPRAVVFAGIQSNGCSRICSQIAESLAAQRLGSVSLVDVNLRPPSLHQLGGAEAFSGPSDVVVKPSPVRDFAVQIGGDGNFRVVPPGSDPQGPLGSDRVRLRMAELRKQFDYILIDAPPLSSSFDAVLLGQVADGIILVVEANSTRRENARIAKETLENAHVNILGAILNNRTFPVPEAIYRRL